MSNAEKEYSMDEMFKYQIVKIECISITLTVVSLISKTVFSYSYTTELNQSHVPCFTQSTNILLSILTFVTVSSCFKLFNIALLLNFIMIFCIGAMEILPKNE